MSYTLSFVSVGPGKEDGESNVTIKVNGNIPNFVSERYGFAINGVPLLAIAINDDGTATFIVATDLLPVTFTIITSDKETVPGSQLVAPPPSSSGGLSDGAIIGIIFGSIILLAIIYYYSYVKYFNMY